MSEEKYFVIQTEGRISYIWESTEAEILESLSSGSIEPKDFTHEAICNDPKQLRNDGFFIIKGILVKPKPVQAYKLVKVNQ